MSSHAGVFCLTRRESLLLALRMRLKAMCFMVVKLVGLDTAVIAVGAAVLAEPG